MRQQRKLGAFLRACSAYVDLNPVRAGRHCSHFVIPIIFNAGPFQPRDFFLRPFEYLRFGFTIAGFSESSECKHFSNPLSSLGSYGVDAGGVDAGSLAGLAIKAVKSRS